ncbi:hypothetical protein L2E82_51137 [Cichorium intybus]|nr:hypothetical protein L2E82_51137 [Cichorium intybus]
MKDQPSPPPPLPKNQFKQMEGMGWKSRTEEENQSFQSSLQNCQKRNLVHEGNEEPEARYCLLQVVLLKNRQMTPNQMFVELSEIDASKPKEYIIEKEEDRKKNY